MKTIKEILESKSYVCNRVFLSNRFNVTHKRCELLIKEAVGRMQRPAEYRFLDQQYFQFLTWPNDTHTQFAIHEDIGVIAISACIEKSNDYAPLAIFPIGRIDDACEFFVNIVSHGEVEINWELFLNFDAP